MFKFGTKVPTSVDGVMATFQAAIADLRTVAAIQTDEAAVQAERAQFALAKKAAAEVEAARATSIAKKMEAVFE